MTLWLIVYSLHSMSTNCCGLVLITGVAQLQDSVSEMTIDDKVLSFHVCHAYR